MAYRILSLTDLDEQIWSESLELFDSESLDQAD